MGRDHSDMTQMNIRKGEDGSMENAHTSQADDTDDSGSTTSFVAIRVAIIDLADEMPTLSRTRRGKPDYGGAWVLVLDKGAPLGVVEFSFTDDTIGGGPLRDLLLEGTSGASAPDSLVELADDPLPFASIVIPTTFDRFEQLQRCVELLGSLDYPEYEIVVVDNRPHRANGETERQTIAALPRVRVVTEDVRGISAARNCGVTASSGEFVAFTDDDVRPHRAWLRRLGTRYALEPDVSCITGLVVPDEFETVTQVWFEESGVGLDRNLHRYAYRSLATKPAAKGLGRDRYMVRRRESDGQVDHWLYMMGSYGMGCNMSFRRKFLDDYGTFDLALGAGTPSRGGEDIVPLVELLFAGETLAYEPSAIVSHAHRSTVEELEKQIYGYGVGFTAALTSLAWRNPRHLVGYARVLVPGLRAFLGFGPSTRPEKPTEYPSELTRLELKGLLLGPIAYVHSRWKFRNA
jgi:glycosyltransferase involved in cell wall biosynthesis